MPGYPCIGASWFAVVRGCRTVGGREYGCPMTDSAPHPEPSPVYKRGTVLCDRLGRRWRVSIRGNAYEINAGSQRLGSHRYARLGYLEADFGALTPELRDEG